jgi:hypothetical protein
MFRKGRSAIAGAENVPILPVKVTLLVCEIDQILR